MTLWRALLMLAIVALAASACGGSDAEVDTADGGTAASGDVSETGTPTDAADAGETTDAGEGTDADAASPSPVPGTDPTAEAAATDPASAAQTMVRTLFNIDPTPEAVDCLLAERERLSGLATVIDTGVGFIRELSDDQLRDLAYGINGCVDAASIGGWAAQAIGASGDVATTAPACFADRFADADRGDSLFHTFVALSFQYRYDPEMVDPMVDTFATCAPVRSLVPFLADQAEASGGFDQVVDRDCLEAALDNDQASDAFWRALVDGFTQPIDAVASYISECTTARYQGMLDSVPSEFEPWSGTGALAAVKPPARAGVYAEAPPMTIDPAGSYTAVLTTGGGEVLVRLFADAAPVTVNNFVMLARDGFYDGTVFHRVLDGFMAQGGDPTGTGTGGPGYMFADEVDAGLSFDGAGLLAMANSGPGTNGSQFFITFAVTDWLDGQHTIFGEVVQGLDIVNAIERRDPQAPSGFGQTLESVTILEG